MWLFFFPICSSLSFLLMLMMMACHLLPLLLNRNQCISVYDGEREGSFGKESQWELLPKSWRQDIIRKWEEEIWKKTHTQLHSCVFLVPSLASFPHSRWRTDTQSTWQHFYPSFNGSMVREKESVWVWAFFTLLFLPSSCDLYYIQKREDTWQEKSGCSRQQEGNVSVERGRRQLKSPQGCMYTELLSNPLFTLTIRREWPLQFLPTCKSFLFLSDRLFVFFGQRFCCCCVLVSSFCEPRWCPFTHTLLSSPQTGCLLFPLQLSIQAVKG